MLINFKIHFTLFILKYDSCIIDGCAILRISLQTDIYSLVSATLSGREQSFVFTMYLPIGTRIASRIIASYTRWKRARAHVYARAKPTVGNQFLDLTNFGGTHTYVEMYNFLFVSFGENNAFSV